MSRSTVIRVVLACAALAGFSPALGEDAGPGEAILQRNCGRCHAVAAGDASPLAEAPNLYTLLGTYPSERLDVELSEGIGSRHREMPQIQFTPEEIASIYDYLHDRNPDSEARRPQ